jgi:hypothetical protein
MLEDLSQEPQVYCKFRLPTSTKQNHALRNSTNSCQQTEFLKNLVLRTEVLQVSQAKILRARRRGEGRAGSGRRWLDSEKTSSLVAGCKSRLSNSSGRVVGTGSGRRVRARHPASEGEDVVARRRMHIRCRATRRRRRRIQGHLLGRRIRTGIWNT